MEDKRPQPFWSEYGFGSLDKDWAPETLSVVPDGIPHVLRDIERWVAWDWVEEDGNWRKVPISPKYSLYCNDVEPHNGVSFQEAIVFHQEHGLPGVGIILTSNDSLIAIDIDDCVSPHSHAIDPLIWQSVHAVDTYTEISPSGSGLRLIMERLEPKSNSAYREGRIEIFESQCFVTITGHHVEGTPSQFNVLGTQQLNGLAGERSQPAGRNSGWFHRTPPTILSIHDSWNGNHLFSAKYTLQYRDTSTSPANAWQTPLAGHMVTTGIIEDNRVFYADTSGHIQARDRLSGELIWKVAGVADVVYLQAGPMDSLLVGSRIAVQTSDSTRERALNSWKLIEKESGRIINTERGRITWPSPDSARNVSRRTARSFLVASDGLFEGVDRTSGQINWSHRTAPAKELDQTEVVGSCLVVARFENPEVEIVEMQRRQSIEVPNDGCTVYPYFAVGKTSIGVIQNEDLVLVSVPEGRTIWTLAGSHIYRIVGSSPGRVICQDWDGKLSLVNVLDGSVISSFEGTCLAISSTHIWIHSTNNVIQSIALNDGSRDTRLDLPNNVLLVSPSYDPEVVDEPAEISLLLSSNSVLVSNGMTLHEYRI